MRRRRRRTRRRRRLCALVFASTSELGPTTKASDIIQNRLLYTHGRAPMHLRAATTHSIELHC